MLVVKDYFFVMFCYIDVLCNKKLGMGMRGFGQLLNISYIHLHIRPIKLFWGKNSLTVYKCLICFSVISSIK